MLISAGMAEPIYREAIRCLVAAGLLREFDGGQQGKSVALAAECLQLTTALVRLVSDDGKRYIHAPADVAEALLGMPCLDAPGFSYASGERGQLAGRTFQYRDLRRVIAAEHTGLLERTEREALEVRFKAKNPQKWDENLLSATPTLEMGVDIGDLSAVMLCSVPPNQASFCSGSAVPGDAMVMRSPRRLPMAAVRTICISSRKPRKCWLGRWRRRGFSCRPPMCCGGS
jgi:DEAD/DEAH box helicase domain-containing protein